MTSPTLDALNAALAGRYAVQRELGSGGMATVYLAEDLKHRRDVALKVLHPELAAAIGPGRFQREIAIAAGLTHPHIIALYDSGEVRAGDEGTLLYYAMPYVKGESLRQRLARERQLPIDAARTIATQVASALQFAHQQGVVHRDIKPENILLFEGVAMVADFGIALAVSAAGGDRLTRTGLAIGTPAYMSPEQATGEMGIDARSDIYSLGCVLYEMLAGEPPFTGPTSMSVIARRMTEDAPSVRRLRPATPANVEHAVARALARVPADRFASAAELATALSATDDPRARARSVAVLPFRNMSADAENEYFADGITEDIIANLSRIRALEVISRTSVMPFKQTALSLREIGAQLNVTTLLEGSVRRAGNRVRIVAQLIDAFSDHHLWAETYDRDLTDIFAIQSDVALQIANALRAELSPKERQRIRREPTHDLKAYEHYLRGRQCFVRFTGIGFKQAIDYFRQAIAEDPQYALAWAGVALAYLDMAESGLHDALDAIAKARESVERALAADSELADAHAALGYLRFVGDYDWTGAELAFRHALELNPSAADTYDYYGRMLAAVGRFDEAVEMLLRARELDPMAHRVDLATALIRAGRYDEAIEAADAAISLDPNYGRAHATMGWAYFLRGMREQGIAELERAVFLAPGESGWLAQLGEAYGLAGRTDDARATLARLHEIAKERYVSPYHFAYVCTGLGEQDAAIDWLERAQEQRSGAIYGLKGSFLFTPLRSHPRFVALLKRMNLA